MKLAIIGGRDMESIVKIETFFNWYDAARWLEACIENVPEDHYIVEARINYINSIWRAGFSSADKQVDLLDE